MVILTSWECTVQDQLTPKFPIKHKSKTSVLTRGSQFTARTRPAFSPLNLQGVWVDGGPIRGEKGGLENEVCPGWLWLPHHSEPHLYLIPSSRVCNHEVNQHDTRASITPAPFGVTCLLRERIQSKKKKKKKNSSTYFRKGHRLFCFFFIFFFIQGHFLAWPAQCKLSGHYI